MNDRIKAVLLTYIQKAGDESQLSINDVTDDVDILRAARDVALEAVTRIEQDILCLV